MEIFEGKFDKISNVKDGRRGYKLEIIGMNANGWPNSEKRMNLKEFRVTFL